MRRRHVFALSVIGMALIALVSLIQPHAKNGPETPLFPNITLPDFFKDLPFNSPVFHPSNTTSEVEKSITNHSSTSPKPQQYHQVRIYFSQQSTPNEIHHQPVPRTLPLSARLNTTKSSADGHHNPTLTYVLLQLLKGPNDEESAQGLYSEIPKGTRLLGLNSTDKIITINLSKQFVAGGGSHSMLARLSELTQTIKAALAKSNTPNASVYLQMDGKPLRTLGGEGLDIDEPIVAPTVNATAVLRDSPYKPENTSPVFTAQPSHN
jgi:spore germination protein GerM